MVVDIRQRFWICVAAIPLFLLAGCGDPGNRQMRVSLSGAQIPVELVESWLGDARVPHFDVERVLPVFVSQNGFEKLLRGKCDMACTDRPIGPQEREDPESGRLIGMRVAFYAYALYVNPANPLESLYAGHLGLVFKQSVTDWKQLGSVGEGPIHLHGPRKATRGGEVLMRQTNVIYDPAHWQVHDTDAEIVKAVRDDPLALGFAGVGHDQGARYLGLRMERNEAPLLPSRDNIEGDRYGLAKVIYVYYADPPSPAVSAVLDRLFSEAGRKAIESTGCWQIPRERAALKNPR